MILKYVSRETYLYCNANFVNGDNAIGNISVSFHRPSDIIKTIAYVDTTPIIVTINTDGSIIANTNEELKGNFIFNVTYDTVSQV